MDNKTIIEIATLVVGAITTLGMAYIALKQKQLEKKQEETQTIVREQLRVSREIRGTRE